MIMLACCALVAGFPAASFGQATSSWVYYDSHGKLRYGTDAAGNRIIDYSWAGYRGGGVALPRVPVRVTVNPSGGDDTAAIQSAIDTVSALQPDRRGFRGAVLLSPGSFNVSATLHITTSGVVLAGSGSGTNGSILTMTGSPFAQFLSPPGGSIATYTFAGRISQVGIEHLRIVAPATTVTSPLYQAATLSSVQNGWLRDLSIQDTENTFQLSNTNKQITLDSISVVHTVAQTNSAAPADFALSGTQILVNNCSVTGHGNTWPFVTQAQVTGPVVVLEAFADDRGFAPHQRWATGLLCDLCQFPSSFAGDKTGIAYSNRGNFGSGQGWDAGWSVAWNVATTDFLIQAPPGSTSRSGHRSRRGACTWRSSNKGSVPGLSGI
jgi:hypothetical protein